MSKNVLDSRDYNDKNSVLYRGALKNNVLSDDKETDTSPTRGVDVSGIDRTSLEIIKSDLSAITGLSIVDEFGILTYLKRDGEPIIAGGTVSATARNDLIKVLNVQNQIIKVSIDSTKPSETKSDGKTITLNPNKINSRVSGAVNVDKRTSGWGMTLLHEFLHTMAGGGLDDIPNNAEEGNPGPVETLVNTYRAELNAQGGNWGQRLTYDPLPKKTYNGYTYPNIMPFSKDANNETLMLFNGFRGSYSRSSNFQYIIVR